MITTYRTVKPSISSLSFARHAASTRSTMWDVALPEAAPPPDWLVVAACAGHKSSCSSSFNVARANTEMGSTCCMSPPLSPSMAASTLASYIFADPAYFFSNAATTSVPRTLCGDSGGQTGACAALSTCA
eukprot:GHVU01053436.1.p2 GENE.GHVU01053436.1~~GHVU01053436.1.p2  ORF type:complete len:130 (+),score=8.23 GHVU01053436.1:510-899(+)